ncbi:MAG: PBP1A family penicillin-binding protein [Myxococcota bacterium]
MKSKKLIRILLILAVGLAFLGGTALAAVQIILHDLPKLDQVEDYKPYQVSRVFDSSGNLIGEFAIEKRTIISVKSLPAQVRNAFLGAEDADFYKHQGIDYFGVIRAVLNEVKYQLIGGQRIGGSTITQQTAKTMLLTHSRTYSRKIKEFILAKRIEDALTKDEILNLYLNQIYFGNGAYGIEEAAQTYYGVPAKELTLSQAASLASVPKSPNKINPIKDPERVRQRRDYVLEQMVTHGLIPAAVAQKARLEPIVVKPRSDPYLNKAPYFVEEIRRYLILQYGEDELYKAGFNIKTSINMQLQLAANDAMRWGLRHVDKRQGYRGPLARLPSEDAVQTAERIRASTRAIDEHTIVQGVVKSVSDVNQQAVIELGADARGILPLSKMGWARPFNPEHYTQPPKKMSAALKAGDIILVRVDKKLGSIELSLEQKPLAEGALVAIHPQTHRVLAMVGGYDFASSNFNRATQARRQPGSSFKPFVYVTAIDESVATPATLIDDSPKEYQNWRPKNDKGVFLGKITLRSCLVSSINICSISLMEQVGIGAVLDLVERAGEVTPETPMPRDLTLALGSGEVVPLLHVNAFSIFPAAGMVGKPIMIEKIQDGTGKVLFLTEEESHPVIKPASAFVMTNMMRSLMAGSGKRITGLTAPLAGKTGTTNEFRSAWFVGFSQDLVAGVYVGFDDNRSLGMNEYGAVAALPIWGQFMTRALKVMPAKEFVQPSGVVWRLIDQKTGELASTNAVYDPGAGASVVAHDESEIRQNPEVLTLAKPPIMEAFVAGTEPGFAPSAEIE